MAAEETVRRLDLPVAGPSSSSSVLIGAGRLDDPPADLLELIEGRQVFVLTSAELVPLLRKRLATLLEAAGAIVELDDVPDGEDAKTVAVAGGLWERMLAEGGKRDSLLVTLGGGSIGDLGGFVAGCFLRGIDFIQVPSTLLAQVDASIGGKTAVDLPGGKNTVGRFHHPRFVVADTTLLATLPSGELRSGLVEAIKMAALLDVPMFERLEAKLDDCLAGDAEVLAQVVADSARAKCLVVEQDPEERLGRRQVLNFGHTLGHAIEKELGYGVLRHGEAVAYGMLFAVRLAQRLGLLGGDLAPRLHRMLKRLEMPALPTSELAVEPLIETMAKDKKALASGLVWVLPRALGADALKRVDSDVVRSELAPFLDDPWALPSGG
ncbi:MAG: 3-dehydroquinate synthase [Acidobacteriota bacterium]